jgi:hypothetical protein
MENGLDVSYEEKKKEKKMSVCILAAFLNSHQTLC